MTTFEKIIIELAYVTYNILLAKWEAYRFDKEQKKINHAFWASVYGAIAIIGFAWRIYLHGLSWPVVGLFLAAIAMHFPLFSSALNYFRTPRRSFDYHNTTDTNGSKFDLWLGKWYVPVWLASVVGWLLLQFLIF